MASVVYVYYYNEWIEGMYIADVRNSSAFSFYFAAENKFFDYSFTFDFGKLLKFAGGDNTNILRAVLFESLPPQNDSFWKAQIYKVLK